MRVTEAWVFLQVPAQADSLRQIRDLIRVQAQLCGFALDTVNNLVLAVNEACMNVIQHGYREALGNIELRVGPIDAGMEIQVRDFATSISMQEWRPRALEDIRPGGLGVHFIREIMDEVAYLPPPGRIGNLLSMKKYLSPQEIET